MKKRVYLTYTASLCKEPIIYDVGHKFKVITNIRQASISKDIGIMALELDGDEGEINKAVDYFIEKGVQVEPIELGVVE